MKYKNRERIIEYGVPAFYIMVYVFVSSVFLTRFPFVHSDESWLAGLSENMLANNNPAVTEPFFDAKIRYPHAVKVLFHFMQMVVIRLFGSTVWSVRLLSLTAGAIAVYIFYRLARRILSARWEAFALAVIFSLDIQFIYASHFARQEIWIVLVLCGALFLFFRSDNPNTIKTGILLGILTGVSIGLHPNSFLVACAVGCCYLAWLIHNRSKQIGPLLAYMGTTGVFAGIYVGISYFFDSDFLVHYFSNGAAEFGIAAPAGQRLGEFGGFLSRIFHGQEGTYYVADIRFQIILFLISASFLLFFCFLMRREQRELSLKIKLLLGAEAGILAGIFIIGRFSQLSIVFLFPAGWLLIGLFAALFEGKCKMLLYGLLFTAIVWLSVKEIKPWLGGETYERYMGQIAELVPRDAKALGNLNMNFYFDNGKLLDYRNLPNIQGSLDAYIRERNIQFIFYSAELDYYYENRPYFNVIYGNIMFAPALKDYCESKCIKVGEFNNFRYGARLPALMEQPEYGVVAVYRTTYQ